MQGNNNRKKLIIFLLLYVLAAGMLVALAITAQHKSYNRHTYEKLNQFASLIQEKYPEVSSGELMDLLMADSPEAEDVFAKYGLEAEAYGLIKENRENFALYLFFDITLVTLLLAGFVALCLLEKKRGDKKIGDITEILHNINKGDYSFDLEGCEEGALSILESELYKTALALKEAAENSKKDKENLKEALSDISHQLKTPLTALLINLENLELYKELPEDRREMLIKRAKREVNKVNTMVLQLLKLSRFDANTVEFVRKPVLLKDIVAASMDNVQALGELKEITLELSREAELETEITADAYWETEALSNILKNGIEHAASKVAIDIKKYALYREIIVENDGEPISDKDAQNAFNRYYRGEGADKDSVGIGLALAAAIVKQDGGYIIAEGLEKGSRFTLRYLT